MKKVDKAVDDVTILTGSARDSVPSVLQDVASMTGSVREGVDAVGGAAKTIGNNVSSFFQPARPAGESHLGSVIEIVKQVIAVIGMFTGKQKKTSKRKTRRK